MSVIVLGAVGAFPGEAGKNIPHTVMKILLR